MIIDQLVLISPLLGGCQEVVFLLYFYELILIIIHNSLLSGNMTYR